MTLKKYALISEIVGGVAIIISLVVLIVEIRGNTAAVQAATFQTVSDSITAIAVQIGTDKEGVRVYFAGLRGELEDPDEIDRFQLIMITLIRRFENTFYQRSRLEPEQWQGLRNALDSTVSTNGFGSWWENYRILLSSEFQELVDELRDDDTVKSFAPAR